MADWPINRHDCLWLLQVLGLRVTWWQFVSQICAQRHHAHSYFSSGGLHFLAERSETLPSELQGCGNIILHDKVDELSLKKPQQLFLFFFVSRICTHHILC